MSMPSPAPCPVRARFAVGLVLALLLAGCAAGQQPGGVCGDGVLDPGEACDGQHLAPGASCTDLGFSGGTLGCTAACELDTAGCQGTCDGCPTAGLTQCDGTRVQTCTTVGTCRNWQNTTDCATQSMACTEDASGASCSGTCTDACSDGEKRCSTGTMVQTCQSGASGCLEYADAEDCALTGQICDSQGGGAACVAACSDDCTPSGTQQCAGDVIQSCGAGASGCLEWIDGQDCALSGDLCEASAGTASCVPSCVDGCTPSGSQRCAGNVIQSCGAGASGCLEWIDGQDCALSGLVCSAAGATASCESTCTDNCSPAGVQQCDGVWVESCQTAASGCLDWAPTTDCSATGRTCSGNTCACVNDCSAGSRTCSGTVERICQVDTWGCYHLANGTDCAASGQVCVDGYCEAPGTGYTQTAFTGTYTSIAATGTDITAGSAYSDDGRWSAALPFSVYLYGTAYSTVWMCTNGWVSFGADPGSNNYSNTTLPDGLAPNQAIYGFWDDLVLDEAEWADAAMVWQVSGTAPNRVLTLEWRSLRYLGTSGTSSHRVSWQVKMYETTRVVEILWDRSTFLGATYSATAGIEDQAQSTGITIGTGLTSPPAQDVRFTPN